MKNHKQFLTALALLLGFFANATDRIVAYGGTGGAFSTISAAIAASSAGDRIIIYPSTVAFSENLTITTSLQLLSATEGQQWSLAGNITYNPASAGQSLTISGGNLTGGYINTGINAPFAGTRTKVNITGCKLANGYINFNANNYDMNIASDSIMAGYIYMVYGKVIGNYINAAAVNAHAIYWPTDGVASTDTMYIVGNKIQCSNTNGNYGIYWGSTSQYFYIANNFVTAGALTQNLIYINTTKSASTGGNCILNNSLLMTGNTNSWTMYVNSTSSPTFLFNNLLMNGGSGFYGLYAAGSVNLTVSYNHIGSGFNASYLMSGFTNDGTNVTVSSSTMDNTTGMALTGPAINGGNPDSTHVDLDLTRNDAGTGGGSYKFTNFHPMTNLGAGARTTFMIAPRRVVVGQSFTIKGDGFDK